jgi:hypothetical protein
MPTKNYSHMVMEMDHMVDEDGLGNDGDEGGVEISLLDPETKIDLIAEINIVVVAL